MRRSSLVLAASVMAQMPAAAATKNDNPALMLEPTSPWTVDYDKDQCRLIRQFGEGDARAYLVFSRYGPGERFRLSLGGNPFKSVVDNGDLQLQFGPTENEQKLAFHKGEMNRLPAMLILSQLRMVPSPSANPPAAKAAEGSGNDFAYQPMTAERAAEITHLRVGKPLRTPVILATGPMDKPMAALDKCIDDLMTTWGIDVERHQQLQRPATPIESPGKWLTGADYPDKMIREGQPALVEFRLTVGDDGKPTTCHIQATTRAKEFDNAVCDTILRRARFEPALDYDGQPLTSYYLNTVNFKIE